MGNNLPPGCRMSDSRAPWNQDYPDPDGFCPHCEAPYIRQSCERDGVSLADGLRSVIHYRHSDCGEIVEASLRDLTQPYLEAWRDEPERMEQSIDHYDELREIDNA